MSDGTEPTQAALDPKARILSFAGAFLENILKIFDISLGGGSSAASPPLHPPLPEVPPAQDAKTGEADRS